MSKFDNVGQAKAVRDALITKLAQNRVSLRQIRNAKDNPSKAGWVARGEASHEKDCDAFAEAHGLVVASRAKPDTR